MLEGLGSKFNSIIKNLTAKGRTIKESDLDQVFQDIRVALLDSDVNLRVVTRMGSIIKEKALGAKILESISPSEMIIKITHDAIKEILGDTSNCEINNSNKVTNDADNLNKNEDEKSLSLFKILSEKEERILLVGLQGSGKTTTAAKLANLIKSKTKKSPLVSSVDFYRPAARKQLKILCTKNQLDYFEGQINENNEKSNNVHDVFNQKLDYLKKNNYNHTIFDTAGRLSIDETMMDELIEAKKLINPTKIILVLDSMSGKTAMEVAKQFHEKLKLDGVIFTKLDSDSKSGVILSIKQILNIPILFLCSGEKIDDIDEFIPERIAQRILGMGDIVSLVEKASNVIPKDENDELKKKAKEGKLDLFDVLEQFKFLRKLGGLPFISKFLPVEVVNNANVSEEKIRRFEAIILSMTGKERINPSLVSNSKSRKMRIAKGSGTEIKLIEELLNMHSKISKMAQQFAFFDKDNLKDKIKITESIKNVIKQ